MMAAAALGRSERVTEIRSCTAKGVTDRRSEKKLGLKLALMGKSTGDLVRSQAGSFSSI